LPDFELGPAALRLCVRRTPSPGPGMNSVEVTLRVPSDVGCVEEVVDLVDRHCCQGDCTLSRRFRFNLRVAVAEALANAIIAGNGEDHSKVVLVRAELRDDAVLLSVTDEGPGFDVSSLPSEHDLPDLERSNGRGLFLIRHLVDDFYFNPQGNSICMTLRRH
jgi:serine/threonine-protein kinase RsbW